MPANALYLLIAASSQTTVDSFAASLHQAVSSGVQARVESMFARPADAAYLFRMAQRRGGIPQLKVYVVKAPGPPVEAGYWAVFSARQDLEDDHDFVVPLLRTETGFQLGREIPESYSMGYGIKHVDIDARFAPTEGRITVRSDVMLTWNTKAVNGPLVMRLNQPYNLEKAWADGKEISVLNAKPGVPAAASAGTALKAGGLVILAEPKQLKTVALQYSGIVDSPGEDKIKPSVAFVTGWWVPGIGRLPHTTKTRITGPADWEMFSEGEPIDVPPSSAGFRTGPAEETVAYRCDVPISYPKIVAGKYTMMGERTVDGRLYRSYQLVNLSPERAKKDLDLIEDSIKFFEKTLGPFPFKRYFCVDADTYYGIESYSYTLLRDTITTRFVTHEIGHTYFGGVVPNTYVHDSWNESLTQYVDSVLYANNRDRSLQTGLGSIGLPVPLSKMGIPHEHGSATYFRGAYVMRMLENEIGLENVVAGMQRLVISRIGRDTRWDDLRSYFEEASGKELKWFWDQWVHASIFPTLKIKSVSSVQREGKFRTFVTVEQSGTDRLYKLKFDVTASRFDKAKSVRVDLSGNQTTVTIDTDEKPDTISLGIFGLSYVHIGEPFKQSP